MATATMIDEARLADAVRRAVGTDAAPRMGTDPVLAPARRLAGGSSGLTYLVETGAEGGADRVVVRVAPPGVAATGSRDVLRQAALLAALSDTEVPVPRVVATWPGDAGIPPFYATEYVTGEVYEPIFDGPGRCPDAEIRSRALRAAALLAVLHGLDPVVPGVALGPPVTPADEVERWTRAFASVPEDLRGDAAELGRALGTHTPDPVGPTLTHGDFRLGNMIAVGGSIRAVVDWEIWSYSDPRLDLAWFVTQADAASHPLAVWQPPGMPDPAALVAAYRGAGGVETEGLRWFAALVRFKVAATSALIVKHDRAAAVADPARRRWEPGIPVLIRDGLRLLGAGR